MYFQEAMKKNMLMSFIKTPKGQTVNGLGTRKPFITCKSVFLQTLQQEKVQKSNRKHKKKGAQVQKSESTSACKLKDNVYYDRF